MAAFHLSSSVLTRGLCKLYMQKFYAPRFDFHIAVSDYTAAELRRVLPAGTQDNLYVEPMGVDYVRFSRRTGSPETRSELVGQLGGNARTVVLIYAGRLGHEKNLLLLPATLRKLASSGERDFRLIIAGTGPMESKLRNALEEQAPCRALFLGHCETDRLAELYAAADVFVHPNAHEPFGIAPLEAMAAGLPMVAPASGGLLTYANRQNAWLTEPTPEAFAAAVRTVIAEEAVQREKSARGQKTAQAFAWSRATERYFQLYDRLHARFQEQTRGRRGAGWKKELDAVHSGAGDYAAA